MMKLINLPDLFTISENKQKVDGFFWDLIKSWLIDNGSQNASPDKKEMLDFYEELKKLLEEIFAPERLPDPDPEPESFPEEIRTIESYFVQLIQALKILVDPDMIYLFDLPNLGHTDLSHRRELYVVLQNQDLEQHHNTTGLFTFLTSGKQEFAIHCVNRNQLSRGLGKGHLFFQYHFRQLHLIYRKEGVNNLKEVEAERLSERMLHLKPGLELNWQKSDNFWNHALQEQDNGNWEYSMFFLHQTLELRLRALILAWERRELKSHETKVLLRECYQFIPELAGVFPQDSEEEIQLLQILEDSYSKSRYTIDFQVDEGLCRKVSYRVAQVRDLSNKHYEYYFKTLVKEIE